MYLKKNISPATWDSCRNILISETPRVTSLIFLLFLHMGLDMFFHWI